MGFTHAVLIALALAADCFAVSVTGGIQTKNPASTALKFALFFGAAQALMLLGGYSAGAWIRAYILNAASTAAFLFLTAAGVRMTASAFKETKTPAPNMEHPGLVLSLALATSIDALVVGMGISLMYASIGGAALIVGAVSFGASFTGVIAGDRVGAGLRRNAEAAGGILLIIIGINILAGRIF